MITKTIKGNILDTELSYIIQGVNAQNKMGSGLAKVIFDKYPIVKKEYHQFYEDYFYSYPTEGILGKIHIVDVSKDLAVINAFTQEFYGYDGKKYVSYDAIHDCFSFINKVYSGETLAIPRIGAGLAGGNWEVIRTIIDSVTPDIELWLYELE